MDLIAQWYKYLSPTFSGGVFLYPKLKERWCYMSENIGINLQAGLNVSQSTIIIKQQVQKVRDPSL